MKEIKVLEVQQRPHTQCHTGKRQPIALFLVLRFGNCFAEIIEDQCCDNQQRQHLPISITIEEVTGKQQEDVLSSCRILQRKPIDEKNRYEEQKKCQTVEYHFDAIQSIISPTFCQESISREVKRIWKCFSIATIN